MATSGWETLFNCSVCGMGFREASNYVEHSRRCEASHAIREREFESEVSTPCHTNDINGTPIKVGDTVVVTKKFADYDQIHKHIMKGKKYVVSFVGSGISLESCERTKFTGTCRCDDKNEGYWLGDCFEVLAKPITKAERRKAVKLPSPSEVAEFFKV